jgi:hypothetical protein
MKHLRSQKEKELAKIDASMERYASTPNILTHFLEEQAKKKHFVRALYQVSPFPRMDACNSFGDGVSATKDDSIARPHRASTITRWKPCTSPVSPGWPK